MPFDSPQSNNTDQTQITWRDNWTLVVDLGLVFPVQGPHGKLGAEESLHELESKLAAIPPSPRTNTGDVVRLFVGALAPHQGPGESKYDFNVYKLQAGHLKLISSAPTAGMEADLRNLTGAAAPRLRGEKMGLVINAHGTPSPGYLVGGTADKSSSLQPEAFAKIVNTWLNADPLGFDNSMSAGRKLEFLDRESCFSAKLGGLSLDAKTAKNEVASELVVHEGDFTPADGSADQLLNGQNIARIYEDLVRRPSLTGAELADLVIADADNGANDLVVDGKKYSATPILAHYDLGGARDDFMKSLDGLGAALTSALANPASRKQIDSIIDKMPDLWSDEDSDKSVDPKYSGRDLKTFMAQLKSSIADKSLADPDGSLSRAIDTAGSAESSFVKSLHAASGGDEWYRKDFINPEKLGGVSVSLPPESVREDKSITQEEYEHAVVSDTFGDEAPNWKKFLNSLRDQAPN